MTTTLLTHVKVQLALHELRPGTGRPLLLLHGLGERTPPPETAGADDAENESDGDGA